MTISRNEACRRLSSLGIRQDVVHSIIDLVKTWSTKSGQEWTVTRLKAIKTDYIRKMAGIEERSPWIAYKSDGSPSGPFGHLFTMTGRKGSVRALNALMVYSSFTSDHVTDKQWLKFHGSVVNPPSVKDGFETIYRGCLSVALEIVVRKLPIPFTLDQCVLGNTRVPGYDVRGCRENDITSWLPDLCKNGVARRLSSKYPIAFSGLMPDIKRYVSSQPGWSHDPVFGQIGFIQEAGYKLRAVANPDRIVQFALEPLRKVLSSVLRSYPFDYTFDQDKGALVVQSWLASGDTVHSVDLRDATNNFPLDLQSAAIRLILGKPWYELVSLFEEASTGDWRVKHNGKTQLLRWSKGQPLGLGPSFVSFALGHNLLLTSLSRIHGGKFAILGDDIAISGDLLHKAYLSSLEMLGCPVSVDKCLSSNRVAEFAGKVITSSETIQPYKWRGVSDRNFLTLARNLGPGSIGLLQPRQRRVVRKIMEIPEDFGGLGWNPKGLSYKLRVERNSETIRLLESQHMVPYVKVNSQVNRLRLLHITPQSPFVGTVGNVSASASEPSWFKSFKSGVRDRILSDLRVHSERFSEDEIIPDGFHASSEVKDPRGADQLSIYERKLKTIVDDSETSDPKNQGADGYKF